MRRVRVLLTFSAALVLLVAATHGPEWAPADEAVIHPGVQVVTDGAGQCTANFVFTDGTHTYLGMAAHCAGLGEATDTNGCQAESLAEGAEVTIVGSDGQDYWGELAYSSWLAMQAANESDPNACAYNDFALVRVLADDSLVSPTIPVFGGPVAEEPDGDGAAAGEQVFTYGNSSLRLGLTQLSPHVGTSLGTTGDGWTTPMYTVTPGLPGDSGSAVLSQDGEALGILVTLGLAPLPGSNGVTSLERALDYATDPDAGGMTGLQLAEGDPFGSLLSITGGLLG